MKTHRSLIVLLGTMLLLTILTLSAQSSAAEAENWNISGTVMYYGNVVTAANIEVAIHPNVGDPPVTNTFVSLPGGPFTFTNAPDGSTGYVSAFIDLNGSGGPPDPGEPLAWYDGNLDGVPDEITATADLAGIDIPLGDLIYVDPTATGNDDGTAWLHAYTDLQSALGAATSGTDIWIAGGTFFPTTGSDRSASFQLQSGVRLFGGFDGTELLRHRRDWAANQTILSGDIGTTDDATDNSYNVVNGMGADRTAVLDGVIVTGGYADGSGMNDKGGGLYAGSGSPTIANVRFLSNYAANHGGGMVTEFVDSHPLVINCVFSGNSTQFNGGGLANLSSGSTTLINSTVVGNSGGNGGGIVNLQSGKATVANTIVGGNAGGQIGLQTGGIITVTYSLVEGGYIGTGNFDGDPAFIDVDGADNVIGTPDDDLRLGSGSAAIDRGDNSALPADGYDLDGDADLTELLPLDLAGNPRRINVATTDDNGSGTAPLVDVGAYEAFNYLFLPSVPRQ